MATIGARIVFLEPRHDAIFMVEMTTRQGGYLET